MGHDQAILRAPVSTDLDLFSDEPLESKDIRKAMMLRLSIQSLSGTNVRLREISDGGGLMYKLYLLRSPVILVFFGFLGHRAKDLFKFFFSCFPSHNVGTLAAWSSCTEAFCKQHSAELLLWYDDQSSEPSIYQSKTLYVPWLY